MLKDEALKWRERMALVAAAAAAKAGFDALPEDGKLYHDEVDGQARWAQRFALPGWPHAAPEGGAAARPGLRYEVWYRPGKSPGRGEEELGLLLILSEEAALAELRTALGPVFAGFLAGGKAAGRYKALGSEPLALRLEAGAIGLARRVAARPAKAEPALAQLIEDTLRPVAAAVAAWQAGGGDAAPYDPLAALRAKFGP